MKYNFEEVSPAGSVRIYRNKLIIGMLNKSPFKQDAYGEFLGTMLRFSGTRFFNTKIRILDIEGTKIVGEIRFKNWFKEVTVTYQNQAYPGRLSDDSGRWLIEDQGQEIRFESPSLSETTSIFEQNNMNPAVVLATLYIRGIYKMNRMIVVGSGVLVLIASVIISINLISS